MRRQRLAQAHSGVQKAEAWLAEDEDSEGSHSEERLFIEDDADGCWVTFDADSAGNRVLIGRGAFSKVGTPATLPAFRLTCFSVSVTELQHAAFQTLLQPLAPCAAQSLPCQLLAASSFVAPYSPMTQPCFANVHGSHMCTLKTCESLKTGVPGAPGGWSEGGAEGAVSGGGGAAGDACQAAAGGAADATCLARRQRGAVLRRQPGTRGGRCARHGVSPQLRVAEGCQDRRRLQPVTPGQTLLPAVRHQTMQHWQGAHPLLWRSRIDACAGTVPGATCGGCSATRCSGCRCCGAAAAGASRSTQPGAWRTCTPATSYTGGCCAAVPRPLQRHLCAHCSGFGV